MASTSLKAMPACATASLPARAINVSRLSSSSLPNLVCAQPMIAVIDYSSHILAFSPSNRAQVPFEIALGRLGVEAIGLDFLHGAIEVDEFLAEIFLENRGARKGVDCVIPVAGNVFCPFLITI